jgi:hypothetical protein
MKTILTVCLACVAVSAANAQIYRPQSVNRDGGSRHAHVTDRGRDFRDRNHGRGGYHDFHHRQSPYRHGGHFDRIYRGPVGFGYLGGLYRPAYYPRYSYVPSYGYYRGYGYGYPYYDGYDYGYQGPRSAAVNGLLLGALAGGIIGHNSGDLHHSAWRGSAWGAGLGWLLGSVVDANRRPLQPAAPVVVQPAAQLPSQPPATTQPQQVTIINNYYHASTPMSGVNGMFGR